MFWYGIQVCLLNPVIKELFNKECVDVPKSTKNTNTRNKKKPPIKYIKKLVIDDDLINKDENVKNILNRKTKIWYVTGHWRNQATKYGHKQIFIQGYWKGILRDIKTAEPRERELVINMVGKDINNTGFFHPGDIGEDITEETLRSFINRGDVSIDWVEGRSRRQYFLRMRKSGSPIIDPSFNATPPSDDWEPYHDIIDKLVDEYGYDPIEYILDNIIK